MSRSEADTAGAAGQPSARAPRVAVVTVSYGSGAVLAHLLESVSTAGRASVSTIVVDNAAPDTEVERLARAHGAHYLPLPRNVGYGAAINAAAATLPPTTEWILVCNPDVVLGEGSLDRLLATGDANPRIGAVGPAIFSADGTPYPSARSIPSLRTGVGHALFVNLWVDNPWTRAYRNESASPANPRDAGWLSGACVLVRRGLFDELGGFDEGYFMYFEDVDLGYRIGRAGWRNRFEPTARVIHSGAHSTTTESARMIDAHHRSARRFIERKYRGWWLWPVRAVLAVGLRVRSAVIRRRIRPH